MSAWARSVSGLGRKALLPPRRSEPISCSCFRTSQLRRLTSVHVPERVSTSHATGSSLSAQVPCTDPEGNRVCSDSRPSKILRLAVTFALGAGLTIAALKTFPLENAHCEGASLIMDQRAPSLPFSLPSISLLSEKIRRRVFFSYERRIRAHSPPEKVFKYFASVKSINGHCFMTHGDLMRALVPVLPPSESSVVRVGYLAGERLPGELHCWPSEFLKLFDTNGDGHISFSEYNFFTTLLRTSEESFSAAFKMFDRDGNGTVDRDEFQKVMELMSIKSQGVAQHNSVYTGRKVADFSERIGLVESLFGKNGEKKLQYKDFQKFLKHLHEEIIRLEFSHYDCLGQGSIPAQDFGSSMVAAASLSRINQYLDRVDTMATEPKFANIRIYFKDFQQFAELRKKRRQLALAAYAVGGFHGLSKSDFRRAASQVCNVDLSDTAVDIIFHIFDINEDGKLSLDEFLGVQESREIGVAKPTEPGIIHFTECMWNCAGRSRFLGMHW